MVRNIIFSASLLILACAGQSLGTSVRMSGGQLTVDGSSFVVRGVCYSPTPVGRDAGAGYSWWNDPGTYATDFPAIKEMGATTIRAYKAQSATRGALDAAHANGLYVIMGYWVDPAAAVSSSQTVKDGFVSMVAAWKDHPAVLMWAFGNEVDRTLSAGDAQKWYRLLNDAAAAAHEAEGPSFHPVTTANQEIDEIGEVSRSADDASLPALDIWGVNAYRGASFGAGFFEDISGRTAKPYFFSEWGADAFDGARFREDEQAQATALRSQWSEIAANLPSAGGRCLGGTVFEWSDEWWKSFANSRGDAGHDVTSDWTNAGYSDPHMNEEWWGITTSVPGRFEHVPRLGYFSLRNQWLGLPDISQNVTAIFARDTRNYPNPFAAGFEPTRIECAVNGSPRLVIDIFGLDGRKIRALPDIAVLSDGVRSAKWDGRDSDGSIVPSGIYLCKITATDAGREEVQYRKIAVVK